MTNKDKSDRIEELKDTMRSSEKRKELFKELTSCVKPLDVPEDILDKHKEE